MEKLLIWKRNFSAFVQSQIELLTVDVPKDVGAEDVSEAGTSVGVDPPAPSVNFFEQNKEAYHSQWDKMHGPPSAASQEFYSDKNILALLDFMVDETQKKREEVVQAPKKTYRRSKYSIEGGPSFDLGYNYGTPSFLELSQSQPDGGAAVPPSPKTQDGVAVAVLPVSPKSQDPLAADDIGADVFSGLNPLDDVVSLFSDMDHSDGMGCRIECGVAGVDYDSVSEFMITNKAVVSGMKLLRKQVVDYLFSDYAQKVDRYFFILLITYCFILAYCTFMTICYGFNMVCILSDF